MQEWRTTKIKRETLLRLRSVKVRFGFASLNEVFTVFLAVRDKMCWTREDLICLGTYGKIPEVAAVEGRNDEECRAKLGLGGPKTEKISELPDVEKVGKASTELLKEKKEEK